MKAKSSDELISKHKTLNLLSEDWKFLEILHNYPSSFFEATKLLSTRNFSTHS